MRVAPRLFLVLAGLWACACRSARVPDAAAPSEAAQAAVSAALDAGIEGDDAKRIQLLVEAVRLAPDWALPARLIDQEIVDDLHGPELLARRVAEAAQSSSATRLYLLGRLQGADGSEQFRRATRLDPSHAWSWHALGVRAAEAGRAAEALAHARHAFEHAQGAEEEAHFGTVLATRLAALERVDEALELLERLEARLDARRLQAECRLLRAELLQARAVEDSLEQGFELGLEVLSDACLSPDACERLAQRLALWARSDERRAARYDAALAVALRSAPAPLVPLFLRWQAERAEARGDWDGALALLEAVDERAGAASGGPRLRVLRLRAGRFVEAFEARAAEFEGLVAVQASLSAPLEAARAAQAVPDAATLGRLARICLERGLHEEADAVARHLRAFDADEAASVLRAAALARAAYAELAQLTAKVDDPRAAAAPRELDAFLARMAKCFAPVLEREAGELARAWQKGPRESHMGLATLLEPLPEAGRDDLAAAARRLGRFAIVGDHAGSVGPDVAMLPLLCEAPIAGSHLGIAWSGTLSLCEAADIEPRAGRAGAAIAGAALHRGFWLDLDKIRPQIEAYDRLREAHDDPASLRGLFDQPLPATSEPARLVPSLGEGRRMVLAALLERGGGSVLERVSMSEVLSLSLKHEEGHLVDRALLLPAGRHLGAVLALLASSGFSPRRLQEELELRAELVAWCSALDPRIAVAKTVSDAESGGRTTPHADAYRRLVQALLDLLFERPELAPGLDRGAPFVLQLHRLSAEELRAAALELSRRLHLRRGGAVKAD